MDDETLKRRLSPEQYRITRCAGTERAFTGPHWNEKRPGTYACVCCGRPLFDAATKYDSGSGWPSFYAPIDEAPIAEYRDVSHGMIRTEIRCAECEAHLGHVFDDGPQPTGLRYCVNGNALDFQPDEDPKA